jgi:hypothetical protein
MTQYVVLSNDAVDNKGAALAAHKSQYAAPPLASIQWLGKQVSKEALAPAGSIVEGFFDETCSFATFASFSAFFFLFGRWLGSSSSCYDQFPLQPPGHLISRSTSNTRTTGRVAKMENT